MKIYQLKNQLARSHTETKEKTKMTKGESSEEERRPRSRESILKTSDKKKPMTPIKRNKLNP